MEKVILAFVPNFFVKDQIMFVGYFLNNFISKNQDKKTYMYGYNYIKVLTQLINENPQNALTD